jgi:hypothetical protein
LALAQFPESCTSSSALAVNQCRCQHFTPSSTEVVAELVPEAGQEESSILCFNINQDASSISSSCYAVGQTTFAAKVIQSSSRNVDSASCAFFSSTTAKRGRSLSKQHSQCNKGLLVAFNTIWHAASYIESPSGNTFAFNNNN